MFLNWRKCLCTKGVSIILTVYVTTFVVILPMMCQDWVYSPFFHDDDAKLMDYVKIATKQNDRRFYEAQLYFAEIDANEDLERDEKRNLRDTSVDIVYGILSKNREPKTGPKFNLGYLTQTLAGLHKAAMVDHRLGAHKVILCNIDEEPDKFSEVSYIQDYAQVFQRYPDSRSKKGDNFKKLWKSNQDSEEDTYDQFEKQKDDMIFCLEKALSFSPRLVLMLEDDTIVKDDFVSHIHHHIYTSIPSLYKRGIVEEEDWAYIKLYYPEKWRGYSNSIGTIIELVGIFLLGGSLSVILWSLIVQYLPLCINKLKINQTFFFQSRKKTNRTMWIYFILGGTYTVLVCYCIGRVYVMNTLNLLPVYTKLVTPSPGCCTQAVLYQARLLPKLVKFLKDQRCHIDYAHDLAIDKFTKEQDFLTFVVEPNLAVHIGMVSSVRAWAKVAAEYIYL